MIRVPVEVDNRLRIDGNLLGSDAVCDLIDAVTIPNRARMVAKRMKRWGWQDLPENFVLADMDGDTLEMPRGYALQLKKDLRKVDKRVVWIDKTYWKEGPAIGPDDFSFRAHQPEAIRQILRHKQGIYKAPTGSGKTVTVIGAVWALHPDSVIIIVNTKDLLYQWQKAFLKHTDISADDIGIIGDGKFVEKRITIATAQTLHKRREQLIEDGFFERWPMMVLDEAHHASAATLYDLVDLFTSRYRFGVSATPDKGNDFSFVLNILGEIFHEDDEDHLRELGLLVRPHVEVIHTNYTFPYHGTIDVEPDEECPIRGCRRSGTRHGHRDNYQKLKEDLSTDLARNQLIAQNIEDNFNGRHSLVISSEIRQLDAIRAHLGLADLNIYLVTGKTPKKERRQALIDFSEADEAVLLSTVAGEGLDIPVIDVVHLVFPSGSVGTVTQWIGRGTRTAEGKEGSVIFDYADSEVSVLAGQFMKRRWKVYEKKGLEVIVNE